MIGNVMTDVKTRSTGDASIPELINELSTQTARLVRDEVRLAQKEFQRAATRTGVGAGLAGAGGVLAFAGVLALTAAGIAALSLVLPVWAAAMVVAVVLFAAAGVAALVAKKQVTQAPDAAHESIASVQADVDTVKRAVS